MDNLMNVVKSNFAPVILVICSPDAEAVLKRSETTLVKLLNKHNFISQMMKVRTIGEQSYDFKGFQIRFCSLTDLEARCAPIQQQEETSNKYLAQVASYHASEKIYCDFRFTDKESIPAFQKALNQKDPTPWYTYYRWEYLRSMGVSELECFEHPVACLLVASSGNDKVVESILSLYDDRNPPVMFRTGVMDPNIPKFCAVLHDPTTTDYATADKKLNQVRVTFGKEKGFLLKVNSLDEKNAQGSFMSSEDTQGLETFTREFVTKSIIPHMEKTVRSLNEYVDSTRKGIGNKLNRWLGFSKKQTAQGGKDKPLPQAAPIAVDADGNVNQYPLGSIENIQKRLGDYLFMLQDYPEALNTYRNAAKDSSNDKAWKYHAAASEMCGLCIFLMDPLKKDLESYLDSAYSSYVKDNMGRHVVRATIFFADILRMRKSFSEAAQKFIRAAERESEHDRLCAALLQEQASFCMLFSTPSQFRKFTFRLVLAGHLYNLTNQVKHSHRCYASAYYLYKSKNWFLIDDHVHFTLCRQSFSMGRTEDAITFMKELLSKNSQPAHKQSSYLREFVHIFSTHYNDAATKMPPIPLPNLNYDTLAVFLRDFPPKSPDQEMWRSMLRDLKNEGKYFNAITRVQMRNKVKERKNKPKLSAVNEPIYIEIEVQNPLQVTLQFTKMQLMGSWEPSPPAKTAAVPVQAATPKEQQPAAASEPTVEKSSTESAPLEASAPAAGPMVTSDSFESSAPEANDAFTVSPFDLLLEANEVRKLRLSITPLKTGILTIVGLGFALCGVWGSRPFDLPKRRLNDTPAQRRGVFYETNLELSVKITSPMPLLDVEIHKFPTHLLHGQIERVNVTLRNSGSSALKDVRLKLNEPSFFSFAENDDSKAAELALKSKDPSIIHLPIDSLAPNSAVTIPMWIRGAKVGVYPFHFIFFYRSEIPNTEMKYRLSRVSKQSRILPSLKSSATTSISYSSINAYLLNLEVTNLQGSAEFRMKHIAALSPSWTLQPLSALKTAEAGLPGYSIGPEQTTSLFFRITPVKSDNTPEGVDIPRNEKTKMYHTNTTLDKTADKHTIMPHYDFLKREKYVAVIHEEYSSVFAASLAVNKKEEEPVIDLNSMDLVIQWETILEGGEKITLQGVHNVCNITFLTQQTSVDKAASENTALRFSIESPRKIVHDFAKESLCLVPVLFHCNNASPTNALTFYLETMQPHEQVEINPGLGISKRSQYFWTETTQHYVSDLRPEAKIELKTCVCFTRPGVYNLNRYKFSLKDEGKGSIKQQIYSPFQHIIMVEDKNEMTVLS